MARGRAMSDVRQLGLILLACALASACRVGAPWVRRPGTAGAPPGVVDNAPPGAATAPPHIPLSSRIVHAKEDPATLIAVDGSRCTVTPNRYRRIEVGDSVTCAWTRI